MDTLESSFLFLLPWANFETKPNQTLSGHYGNIDFKVYYWNSWPLYISVGISLFVGMDCRNLALKLNIIKYKYRSGAHQK